MWWKLQNYKRNNITVYGNASVAKQKRPTCSTEQRKALDIMVIVEEMCIATIARVYGNAIVLREKCTTPTARGEL